MPDDARPISMQKASAARLYDHYLGGSHNYPVDRLFAAQVTALCPFMPDLALHNRQFLRRAVAQLAAAGIRQFIDIGSGIPTSPNVHEVLRDTAPESRVVYVDNDEEAIAAGHRTLRGNPRAAMIYGDLRSPDSILANKDLGNTIDFTQPVALLIVAVLHFIDPADEPQSLLTRYLDVLAPGSYLAASHISVDEASDLARGQLRAAQQAYGSTSNPATLRTKAEFAAFFAGLELVEPGITFAADWRVTDPVAADDPARPCFYAAVGRKP